MASINYMALQNIFFITRLAQIWRRDESARACALFEFRLKFIILRASVAA